MATTQDIFVSPTGKDRWSGRRDAANKAGTDGPLATIPAALRLARALRKETPASPVRILLRGGTHQLSKPLKLDHRDSGTGPEKSRGQARIGEAQPLVIAACKGEDPLISGGIDITGFRETEHAGQRAWVVDLPAVRRGKLDFRQLFVNDQRRSRPRLPKKGFHSIERLAPGPEADSWKRGFNDRFHYHAGDLQAWHRLQDVELVLLQVWIESRLWLQELDEAQRLATFDRFSTSGLSADADHGSAWFVENVYEALDTPGEWYLDRGTGRLTYLPLPGERLEDAKIVAPVLPHLLTIEGDAAKGRIADYIRFEGICFSHTEWSYEAPLSGCEQAARMVPAAVQLRQAQRIEFEDCEFSHLGNWAVEILDDSRDNQFRRCRFEDLGAGGVKAWHGTQRTTVSDCEIGGCGRIFYSAVGVLVGNSGGNRILHNHIHDVRYTGISLGWHWGYEAVGNQGNIVEYNHIHDIGAGYLSDMGGIYTLGPQQGTRLRYNHIHDVKSRTYGGWGIYPDEGSSDLLIEKNLVHDCNRALFHQHYGRDNVVVNNIFAFGGDGQIQLSCPEGHTSFHFHRNIVLFDSGQLVTPPGAAGIHSIRVEADQNLYFDLRGKRLNFGGLSWSAWRRTGRDRHSLVADPLFVNAAKRNFTMKKASPAFGLGFEPFDLSEVGPRRSM